MQKHTHQWIHRRFIADQAVTGTIPWVEDNGWIAGGYSVTVIWGCRCGASAIHSHTFNPPAVESTDVEADVLKDELAAK